MIYKKGEIMRKANTNVIEKIALIRIRVKQQKEDLKGEYQDNDLLNITSTY